jgi:hypothetical protein
MSRDEGGNLAIIIDANNGVFLRIIAELMAKVVS